MKIVMAVIGFGLLLVGCGQGPAIVTVKDVNSSETITQAKAEESTEAEKPLPKDLKSLKALAEKGDVRAQCNLGLMYVQGQGVEQDSKEAVYWYQKAADQGDAKSQFKLAEMYGQGPGVGRDVKEALKWLRKAAEQGHAEAQVVLGKEYFDGERVEQDFKQGFKWCRKAAEQGHADAQGGLGMMYEDGKGVEQDYVTAHMWFNIAAANGAEYSKKEKDLLAKKMTPDQIAKAEVLVKEMIAKNPKLIKKP